MKKINLLIGTLMTTVALSHAVDSYSDVVGYQKLVSSQGFTTVSMPLVKPAIVTGTVSSKSGSSITLSASIPAGTDSTKPYYLEVTSGALAGERADVTVTAGSAVVVIAASAYNTSALSTLTSGDAVVVRAHITLGDLDASCSPALVGDDVNGDRVLFFVNGAFVPYIKASDGLWYEDGGLDDMSNLPVRPGIGMLIHRKSSTATTLTQTGVVRANKFARPVAKGFSFFAPAYPVDLSPDAMGAKPTFGWSNGDRILPFVNGAFVNNILDTNDTTGASYGTWYEDGGLDPINTTTLVNSQKSAMVYNNNSGAGSVETSPVAQ